MSSEELGVEHNDGADPDPTPELKPFFSRAGGKIFIIWLAMTVVGVLIGIYAPHHLLPTMLSIEGTRVWQTIVLFTILAAPVAAFVYAVGLYSLIGWRARGYGKSDTAPPDGPALRGDAPMTAVWVGVSAVLVIVLLVWGIGEFTAEQTSHPDTLVVDVTGQQWLWTFSYPGAGGVQARSLVLPINRPVQFDVTSVDVTHGFWPAALGVQVDANPNVVTVIGATPNKLGGFTVRCSQLCGMYHSFMYAAGRVVTPQTFASWLHSKGATTTTAAKAADVTDVADVSASS
jgi:cytochrome c oxidase subunit 2